MVRKMMHLKRRPLVEGGIKVGMENWLDWQVRSMSRASAEMRKHGCSMGNLINDERLAWAGKHLAKHLVAWRPRFWWETQKWFNTQNTNVFRHRFPFKPRRWEDSLPMDWLINFPGMGYGPGFSFSCTGL
jgi:hypothetical protein